MSPVEIRRSGLCILIIVLNSESNPAVSLIKRTALSASTCSTQLSSKIYIDLTVFVSGSTHIAVGSNGVPENPPNCPVSNLHR